ncbi:hypothetical protein ACFWD7_06300 [Streptomyces mirabilis]|uniref:hypothetical protein n=1 Tax=Streptomyces mirabilis TaxID=68239 RepID=UPI00368126A9
MPTPTTSYGYELEIADDAGHDDIPVCCGNDMTGKKVACICCTNEDTGEAATGAHTVHTCGDCGTELEIDGVGLVFDIREKAAA